MFRSNLFKNSVTLISSQVKRGIVVARASPYIQNIPHPDHLIVVNGGASIGIAVLERLKTFYSQGAVGQSATVPKSISIVLTPPLAGSETNKFVTTPFG